MRIHVLGTGLEALAAALILRHNGFADVHLVGTPSTPDAPAVELPPNGSRILYATGLRDPLEHLAAAPQTEHHRTARTGYLLLQRPLGAFAADRYKAPHLVIGSTQLRQLLETRLGPGAVPLPPAAADDADLVLFTGTADPGPQVLPGNVVREPTNWTAAWLETRPTGNTITHWASPGESLRQLPTPQGTYARHVAAGRRHPRLQQFTVDAAEQPGDPVYDSPPLRTWFAGNRVLLGSAAHPLLPFSNQDFALALEDAWVLARMLDGIDDDLELALSEYQRYRLPRATRVQAHARELGRRITERSPLAMLRRNLRYALAYWFLPELALQAEDWLYEYDCLKGFE